MLCIIVKYQVKVNHKYSDSNRNGSSETLESTGKLNERVRWTEDTLDCCRKILQLLM